MEFTWDPAAYQALLDGPVMDDLIARAIRVEAAAKQNATERPGPKVRTGRLRGSITWQANRGPVPSVDIGSNVVYAPFVEEGHNVVRGGVVVGRAPAYPYLRPGLEAARTT